MSKQAVGDGGIRSCVSVIMCSALCAVAAAALLADPVNAQSRADLVRECDLGAASALDQTRPPGIPGLAIEKIDPVRAIPACAAALAVDPDNPRLLMQAGRAHLAAKNHSEARGFFERAANLGNLLGMNGLGVLLTDGLGIAKDPVAANALYLKAAEGGLAIAMRNLGHSYADGSGVAASQEEATRWFLKAAEAGDDVAMVVVGARYQDGTGVAQDHGAARRWYESASKLQNSAAMNRLATLHFHGRGGPVDLAEARRWYEQAANLGDREAMYNLGLCYKDGHGGPVDLAAALTWLEKSARLGDSSAMVMLGSFYGTGKGVAQDYAVARRWYEQAAAAGEVTAMYNLGNFEASGRGGPKNMAAAARWYRMAAERGDADAMYWLGRSLTTGDGVAQDYGEARRWFEKAAEANRLGALVELGSLYETGKGVARNYAEARRWYMRAADAGNGRAMMAIALLYDGGLGVPQDTREALRWLHKAADAGYTGAMRVLALAYERGEGEKQNYAFARNWYERAAKAGDADGMSNLARMHASGLGGPPDFTTARRWYGQAADTGHAPSMFILGGYYERGEGTERDLDQAHRWYERAAAAGHAEAQAALARFKPSPIARGRDINEWAREIISYEEGRFQRASQKASFQMAAELAACGSFRMGGALSQSLYASNPGAFYLLAIDTAKDLSSGTAGYLGQLKVQELCLGHFVQSGAKEMSYFLARILFGISPEEYGPYVLARNLIDVLVPSSHKALIAEMQKGIDRVGASDQHDFAIAAMAALSGNLTQSGPAAQPARGIDVAPRAASASAGSASTANRERQAGDREAVKAWLTTLDRLGNILHEVVKYHVDAPDDGKLVEAAIAGMVWQRRELERNGATQRARTSLKEWKGAKADPYLPLQVLGTFLDELKARPGGLGFSEDQLFEAVGSGIASVLGKSARLITLPVPPLDLVRFEVEPLSQKIPALTTRAEGNVIYIGLSRIGNESVKSLTAQVGGLKRTLQNRVTGYVLDLRKVEREASMGFNLGVDITGAVAVADAFLDQGVIAMTQDRNGTRAHLAQPGDVADAMPLVVLIGEASVGEADIIAVALKDNGRATLLGTRTSGMGSRQASITITQTRVLEVTVVRVNRPSGEALEGRPVEPDLEVRAASATLDPFGLRDDQLQAALARIRSGRRQ